jgi:hypothetical protein
MYQPVFGLGWDLVFGTMDQHPVIVGICDDGG